MEPIEDELPPIARHHAAATGTGVLEYISEVSAVSVFTRQGSALCPDLCDQLARGRVPDGLLTDPRPGAERGTTKATTRRSGFAATTNTRTADPAGCVTDRLGRVHRCPVPPSTSRSTSAAAHASSGSTSELRALLLSEIGRGLPMLQKRVGKAGGSSPFPLVQQSGLEFGRSWTGPKCAPNGAQNDVATASSRAPIRHLRVRSRGPSGHGRLTHPLLSPRSLKGSARDSAGG
jgi:hypothetical protein